jgi:hypothetical protein
VISFDTPEDTIYETVTENTYDEVDEEIFDTEKFEEKTIGMKIKIALRGFATLVREQWNKFWRKNGKSNISLWSNSIRNYATERETITWSTQ